MSIKYNKKYIYIKTSVVVFPLRAKRVVDARSRTRPDGSFSKVDKSRKKRIKQSSGVQTHLNRQVQLSLSSQLSRRRRCFLPPLAAPSSTGDAINVSLPNSGFSGPTGRLTHCWHDGLCARSTQVWLLSGSTPKQANSGSRVHNRAGSALADGPELVPGLDRVATSWSTGPSVCRSSGHRCRLIFPSLASLWMTCVSNSALWTPVFLKAPA